MNDPFWEDEVKVLPTGEFVLIKDIKAALNGDDFFYIQEGVKGKIKASGCEKEEWSYYFSIFHNCENFGLPHGGGWVDELPWVIQFLTQMKYVKELIRLDAATNVKKAKGNVVDSMNPNAFGG